MLLTLTMARSSIAVGQPSNLQEELYARLDQVRLASRGYHTEARAVGALVMSDNTRNFYGRAAGLVEERYMANVFGAFRAAANRICR